MTITAISGGGQAQTIETAFADPLVVSLVDAHGNPIAGATVTFSAPATGASATITGGTTTDGDGQLEVTAIAGQVAGAYQVSATVAGVGTPATFALTNRPGAPAALTAAAGSTPQAAQVLTAFAQPLVVTVVDARSNPVPGVTVRFARPESAPRATLSAAEAITGASGTAQVTATAEGAPGSYAITASVGGVTPTVSFALTNTVGPPATLTLISGGAQSALATRAFADPVVFGVRDGAGNDLEGAVISLSDPTAGASLSGLPATLATGANGQASVALTAGATPAIFLLTATVAGAAAPATVALSVGAIPTTLTLEGAPGATTTDTPLSVTATVTAETGVPTGEVTLVLDGSREVGRATLQNGRAIISATIADPGTYAYTVRYAAQGSHAASVSSAATLVVTAAGGPYVGPARVGGGGGCALASGAPADSGPGWLALATLVVALVVRDRRRRTGRGDRIP